MEGGDTEHFIEQGTTEDSRGSIPQGTSGKQIEHTSNLGAGEKEAGMFVLQLPFAIGREPFPRSGPLCLQIEKPSGCRPGVTSVSSKIGLFQIIPEHLGDVNWTPMATRYIFLDFFSKITHTPSSLFPACEDRPQR